MQAIVLVSGGFDPLHSGHIALFNNAAKLGDKLVVAINSDKWLLRNKGSILTPAIERHDIIKNLRMVDQTLIFNDHDDTACNAIELLRIHNPDRKIIFANGGNKSSENTPEMLKFESYSNIEFIFGIGGYERKTIWDNNVFGY